MSKYISTFGYYSKNARLDMLKRYMLCVHVRTCMYVCMSINIERERERAPCVQCKDNQKAE